MKTLLMDIGNSHIKWATLDSGTLSDQQSLSYEKKSIIEHFKRVLENNRTDCDTLLMVSVLGDAFAKESQRIAINKKIELTLIESQAQLAGIKNAYNNPSKLGADRLVAMIAAYHLNKVNNNQSRACIVIDSGTATTIDAIDSDGVHLGGVILSGLSLCSDSLLENTELLPLFNTSNTEFKPDFLSTETSQAIASGCLLGLAGGIDSICNKMEQELIARSSTKNNKVEKIICGGAAKQLLAHTQLNYQHYDNLLMLGLKTIKEEFSNNV